MATVAEVEVIIKGRNDQLKRSMAESKREVDSFATGADRAVKRAESGIKLSMDSIASKARSAGLALTASVTAPLIALGKSAIQAAVDMENLTRGMNTVMGSAKKATAEIAKLKKIAEQPGLGFKEAVQGSIRLQAAGLSAKTAADALKGFGNALVTVGSGKAELDGVVTALSQIASKGKVSAEEINQIAERVPQIRQVMIKAFGTADTEILQKAGITSKAFIEIITSEINKLPKATAGTAEDFEKAWEGALDALRELGKVILPTLTKFIKEQVIPATEKFTEWLKNLTAEGKDTILKVGALALALGPGLGLAGMMSGAIVKGLELIKVLQGIKVASAGASVAGGASAAGAGGPVAAAIAVIAAAGYGVYKVSSDLVNAGDEYNKMYQQSFGPYTGPMGQTMPGYFDKMDGDKLRAGRGFLRGPIGKKWDSSGVQTRSEFEAQRKELARQQKKYQDYIKSLMAGGNGPKKAGKAGTPEEIRPFDPFGSDPDPLFGGKVSVEGFKEYADAIEKVADALRAVAIEKAKLGDPKGANEARFMGLEYQDWKATRRTPEHASLLASKKSQAAPYVQATLEAIQQLTGIGKAVAKEALALSDSYLSEAEIRANEYLNHWRAIWVKLGDIATAAKEKQQAEWDAELASNHQELMAKEFEAQLAREEEQIEAHAQKIKSISEGIAAGISNSIVSAFGNIGRGWKGFLNGLLSGLQQMLADMGRQFIQSQMMRWITSLVGGAFGGGGVGGGGAGQGVGGGIGGGLGLATGGPALAGNAYMVGENGPELFVPNGSGRVVSPSGVKGGGGVVVNMTVNTPDAGSFKESMGQIQARLAQATTRAARRNG